MRHHQTLHLLLILLSPVLCVSVYADEGALVIAGGGRLPDRVYRRFCELAGGSEAKLVIIPTATSDRSIPTQDKVQQIWQPRGIQQIKILHTRDRKQANMSDFCLPLRQATAVWISGGQQSRLAAAYSGTQVEVELRKLLKRGGVIGGSSAGAAIQSRVMIQSGRSEPVIGTGFELLRGAIIDQHFLKRNRLGRLTIAVKKHPNLTGFGIDEGTAIIVQNGKAKVLGESYVMVLRLNAQTKQLSIDAVDESDMQLPLPTNLKPTH